jgi:hypothetical protein
MHHDGVVASGGKGSRDVARKADFIFDDENVHERSGKKIEVEKRKPGWQIVFLDR